MDLVVGVDGTARGWVFVATRGGTIHEVALHRHFADGIRQHPGKVIAVDIPIGLPVRDVRRADAEARRLLTGRASTVFSAPIEAVLDASDYPEANAVSRRVSGKGLTQQAYALVPKIREVEAVWAPHIYEAHPEVSFAAIAGGPLRSSKHTWRGLIERRRLLQRVGLDIPDDIGDAGVVASDDVLDAAAAAWSAARILAGDAVSLPSPPERFGEREVAIWY